MKFALPHLVYAALALLAGLGCFLIWAWRTKQRLLRQFVQPRLLDTLIADVSQQRQKARLILAFLGVGFIAISLARPQWGMAWEETRQRGRDIVVAIDTSRSMLANDIAPDRLTRAKLAALDLMREAKSDRLGLVAFAGTAFLQCPLTLDEEAFRQSVNALDTTIIPQSGSALAEAINTALTAFAKEEDNHKILVLFTDGEDHEEGAIEAAREAAKSGMHIFTIGVGTAEGELLRVMGDDGKTAFLKDDNGNAVKSRLNETLMRQIAGATDKGFYLPLRGASVVETLYKQGIELFPKSDRASMFMQRFKERFQWPLALGIILLTIEMFISERKRTTAGQSSASPASKAAVVGLVLLGMSVPATASPTSARKDFQAGKYREAQEEFARLAESKPGDPRLSYNAGASAYRAGEFDHATEHFTAALRATDVNLQQQAYYNLGNTYFRAGESQSEMQDKINAWEQSVKQFEAAMKLKPEDTDAKFNRDVVSKKLEELKKQQQQQQKQEQKDQDQQKQDDQKDNQDQKKDDQSKQDQQNQKDQEQQEQKDQSQKKDSDKKDSQKDQTKQNQKTDQKQEEKDDKSEQQSNEKQSGGKDDDRKQDGQKKNSTPQNRPENAEEAESQGVAMSQMSIQQATQLLDAQKGDVKALIFRPPETNKSPSRVYKNW